MVGLFAALSLSAQAQNTKTLIVGSEIGRADPIYAKIYGFQSVEDMQDGSNHLAVIVAECRKGGGINPNINPALSSSYVTIQKDGEVDLVEVSHTECRNLYKQIDEASVNKPLELYL